MAQFIKYKVYGKWYKGRYLNTETGKTISRRQYIIVTEGMSPEQKAVTRYEQGLSKKEGVTVKKYKKAVKKHKEQEELYILDIPTKQMNYGLEKRGKYQLSGKYLFQNERTGQLKTSRGYSYVTREIKYGIEFQICREQAIDNAAASLGGNYNWNYLNTISETWLYW